MCLTCTLARLFRSERGYLPRVLREEDEAPFAPQRENPVVFDFVSRDIKVSFILEMAREIGLQIVHK